MQPVNPFTPDQHSYFLIFSQDKLLCQHPDTPLLKVPWQALSFAHVYQEQLCYLGELDAQPCYLLDMGQQAIDAPWQQIGLRDALMQLPQEYFAWLARAWQYLTFMRTHNYCGRCGSSMRHIRWEMARHCDRCQHRSYPRLSPCIIVAIRKGRRILLAQGASQRSRGMHSVLAGFVESGESLEQGVHREVMEEVGIEIDNLRYFGSQSWPFPHSLMVGFLADYKSGEIQVDGKEILEADWYGVDDLPTIPPGISIAGQLIAHSLGLSEVP